MLPAGSVWLSAITAARGVWWCCDARDVHVDGDRVVERDADRGAYAMTIEISPDRSSGDAISAPHEKASESPIGKRDLDRRASDCRRCLWEPGGRGDSRGEPGRRRLAEGVRLTGRTPAGSSSADQACEHTRTNQCCSRAAWPRAIRADINDHGGSMDQGGSAGIGSLGRARLDQQHRRPRRAFFLSHNAPVPTEVHEIGPSLARGRRGAGDRSARRRRVLARARAALGAGRRRDDEGRLRHAQQAPVACGRPAGGRCRRRCRSRAGSRSGGRCSGAPGAIARAPGRRGRPAPATRGRSRQSGARSART
jgi:hypothetical protein